MTENFIFSGRKGTRVLAFELGMLKNLKAFSLTEEGTAVPSSIEEFSSVEGFEKVSIVRGEGGENLSSEEGFVLDDTVFSKEFEKYQQLEESQSPPLDKKEEADFKEEKLASGEEGASNSTTENHPKKDRNFTQKEVDELKTSWEEEWEKKLQEEKKTAFEEGQKEKQEEVDKNKKENTEALKGLCEKVKVQMEEALKDQKAAALAFSKTILKTIFPFYAQEKKQEEILSFIEEKATYLSDNVPMSIFVHPSMVQSVQEAFSETKNFSISEGADLDVLDVRLSWRSGGIDRHISESWQAIEEFCQKVYDPEGLWDKTFEEASPKGEEST